MLPDEWRSIGAGDATTELKCDAVKGTTTKAKHKVSVQQQKQLAEKLERALSTEDAKMEDERQSSEAIITNNCGIQASCRTGGKDENGKDDVVGNHSENDNSVPDEDDRIKVDRSSESLMDETNGNDDRLDAKGMSPNSPITVKVPDYTAYMPTARDAIEYNMQHKNRGMALIFNHEEFDIASLSQRKGTNKDAADFRRALEKLHFNVEEYKNMKFIEIRDTIIKVSEMDHSNSDCILVAILSHGEHGYIYARDHAYKLDNISHYFTAHGCPSLAGKPKLFFIQACQGDRFDPGTVLKRREKTETDGDSSSASYKIPTHADFLFAYSTIPGFYSWRNPENGSWFIQSLVREFEENALKHDLLTLLTFVNRRVALDYESNVRGTPVMDQQKQIPCLTSMLTRVLRFNDKTIQQENKN